MSVNPLLEKPSFLPSLWLAILSLAYATNGADRQLFPVLLSAIRNEFAWSLRDAGLLSTGFTIGLAIVGIPAGLAVDRYSRKVLIITSMMLYSIFTLATIYATGFWDMLLFRALTGIGEGMQMAAAFSIIGSYFHQRRTLYIGLLSIAYSVGSFVGPRIAVWLHLTAQDWRTPFVQFAWAGIILSALVFFFLPQRFTESGRKNATTSPLHNSPISTTGRQGNKNMTIGLIGTAVSGIAFFGFLSLYTVYLSEVLRFKGSDIGATLSYFGLGGFVAVAGGYLGDRFQGRWVSASSFLALSTVGYLIFNGPTSQLAQSILTFCMGAICSGFLYVNMMSLLQRSVNPNLIGVATGIFVTVIYGSGVFGGYLFGWLVQLIGWGNAAAIQFALLPLIGFGAMLLLDQRRLPVVIQK